MSGTYLLVAGENGAELYDSDYDVVIHCKNEQDQQKALERIELLNELRWHDSEQEKPTIKDGEFYAGPFLVTDGIQKPVEAYYWHRLFVDIDVYGWTRVHPETAGMSNGALDSRAARYWMPSPQPPGKEQQ